MPGMDSSFGAVDQGGLIDLKTTMAIAIALGCLLELEGETLLLKTLHMSHRRNQAGPDLKASFLWASFHSTRRAMHATAGER